MKRIRLLVDHRSGDRHVRLSADCQSILNSITAFAMLHFSFTVVSIAYWTGWIILKTFSRSFPFSVLVVVIYDSVDLEDLHFVRDTLARANTTADHHHARKRKTTLRSSWRYCQFVEKLGFSFIDGTGGFQLLL